MQKQFLSDLTSNGLKTSIIWKHRTSKILLLRQNRWFCFPIIAYVTAVIYVHLPTGTRTDGPYRIDTVSRLVVVICQRLLCHRTPQMRMYTRENNISRPPKAQHIQWKKCILRNCSWSLHQKFSQQPLNRNHAEKQYQPIEMFFAGSATRYPKRSVEWKRDDATWYSARSGKRLLRLAFFSQKTKSSQMLKRLPLKNWDFCANSVA